MSQRVGRVPPSPARTLSDVKISFRHREGERLGGLGQRCKLEATVGRNLACVA